MKITKLSLIGCVILLGCVNVFSQDSASYGIISQNIKLKTKEVRGNVHANNTVLLDRNSVDGQITACEKIKLISGEPTDNMVAPVIDSKSNLDQSNTPRSKSRDIDSVPSFTNWPSLPLDYYKSIAQSNNQYYVGNVRWTDRDIDLIAPSGIIPGGVVYVTNGYFSLTTIKKSPLTVCIVADKGIHIRGVCNLIAPTGFPVMVVFGENNQEKTSGIRISVGNSSICGLLYSINNKLDVSGISNIEGQLMSKDLITIGGNSTIIYSNCVDSLITE